MKKWKRKKKQQLNNNNIFNNSLNCYNNSNIKSNSSSCNSNQIIIIVIKNHLTAFLSQKVRRLVKLIRLNKIEYKKFNFSEVKFRQQKACQMSAGLKFSKNYLKEINKIFTNKILTISSYDNAS